MISGESFHFMATTFPEKLRLILIKQNPGINGLTAAPRKGSQFGNVAGEQTETLPDFVDSWTKRVDYGKVRSNPPVVEWTYGVCVKAAIFLTLTLVFTPALFAQAPQTQPTQINDQGWKTAHEAGLKAIEQELYSQAVQAFQVAIGEAEKFGSIDPRLAQSINGMAQAYFLQGNFAAAERQFQQALTIYEKSARPNDPNVAMVLNSLATVQRFRGNFAEATALSRRSLAILENAFGTEHPNVAIGQNNLAMIRRLHGDYEEARLLSARSLSILEKALGPEHVNVGISLNNLVQSYVLEKNYDKAEPLARRSLSIFENTPSSGTSNLLQSLENLAQVWRELGKYDQSEQLYRRVLSIRWGGGSNVVPVLEKFAVMLNFAFFDTSLKEAQEAFQAASGWSGISVDLYVAMARALRDLGLTEEPEDVILRAIKAFPNSLEARYELAQVYAETHKYQAALDTLQQANKVPGSGNPRRDRQLRSLIYEEIARMHGFLFQFDESLTNLKTALELDSGNAHAFVALGDLYLKLDKPEDAAAQYGQAILLTGGNAAAYYGIAEVNRRLGRYPYAVLAADKALEIHSTDTKSSYIRSVALLRDGRREDGEIELERLRKLEAKDRDEGARARAIPVTLHTAAARFESGEEDAALEVLREAVHSYPDSASLQLNLGIIQSRLGRQRDAIKTFQAMIDQGYLSQDYFLVHLNLSREYEILGDMKASRLHRLLYLQKYDAFLQKRK
jgi:tetratricopeptide (TPR) repeat protein